MAERRIDSKTPWWEALMVAVFFSLTMALLDLRAGAEIALGPDAELYLSVADNFLSTGHFIQTAREVRGMVVPFGLPLILTILRLAGLSAAGIVRTQYLVFGLSCLFLYLTEKAYFRWGGPAPVLLTAAARLLRIDLTNIMVEHWYCLFLCLVLWIVSDMVVKGRKTPARYSLLCAAGFMAFAVRPVLGPLYAAVLAYAAASSRKDARRRRAVLCTVLISGLLLGASVLSSYRETGHWIGMENYAGETICLANNPEAEEKAENQSMGYRTEAMNAVRNDASLDQTEKDRAFRAMAKEYILSDLGHVLSVTLEKMMSMFITGWRYIPALAMLCGICMAVFRPGERALHITALLLCAVLAFFTAMGLYIRRYTYFIWPVAAVHLSGGLHSAVFWLRRRTAPAPGKEITASDRREGERP